MDWNALLTVVIPIALGLLGWFLRTLHSEANKKLESIVLKVEPIAVMKEQLLTISHTVGQHATLLPDMKTDIKLLTASQDAQCDKIDAIGDEVSKLREWRHEVSNSLNVIALDEAARKKRHEP